MKYKFDRNGSLQNAYNPETGEFEPLPNHDSSLGYGFDQDMGGFVYVTPLLMCPSCGSLSNELGPNPWERKCNYCGRRFEYWYPHAPGQPPSESMRFEIVDKRTGDVLASDLTIAQASEWVERYNESIEGQKESFTIANRFFKRSAPLPDVETAAEEIAEYESEFIDDNQRMPIMEIGESISFPERKWKLVRSKARKSRRGLLR